MDNLIGLPGIFGLIVLFGAGCAIKSRFFPKRTKRPEMPGNW